MKIEELIKYVQWELEPEYKEIVTEEIDDETISTEDITSNIELVIIDNTEKIKKRVENYCKLNNVYYSNLVITDTTCSFTTYSKIDYETLAKKLIAEKYAIEDELKLHREERENPYNEEYLEYVRYVKECLAKAKEFIAERDNLINKEI